MKEEPTQCKNRCSNARSLLNGTINTIFGGFVGGKSSSLARKRHLKVMQSVKVVSQTFNRKRMSHFTFTDVNIQGVDPDQVFLQL